MWPQKLIYHIFGSSGKKLMKSLKYQYKYQSVVSNISVLLINLIPCALFPMRETLRTFPTNERCCWALNWRCRYNFHSVFHNSSALQQNWSKTMGNDNKTQWMNNAGTVFAFWSVPDAMFLFEFIIVMIARWEALYFPSHSSDFPSATSRQKEKILSVSFHPRK